MRGIGSRHRIFSHAGSSLSYNEANDHESTTLQGLGELGNPSKVGERELERLYRIGILVPYAVAVRLTDRAG